MKIDFDFDFGSDPSMMTMFSHTNSIFLSSILFDAFPSLSGTDYSLTGEIFALPIWMSGRSSSRDE